MKISQGLFCFSLLSLTMILSGCEKNVEDKEVEVTFESRQVTGSYTGTLKSGKAEGEASIIFKENGNEWIYNGTFKEGAASGNGTVEMAPVTFNLDGTEYAGKYTGEYQDYKANGTGKFQGGENVSFDGSFTNNMPMDGTCANLNYTVLFQDTQYKGTYSGVLKEGVPSEQGKFTATEPGYSLSFEGTWVDGSIDTGTLATDNFKMPLADGEYRTCSYEGELVNGKATGNGKMRAINSDNVAYTYEGEWKEDRFDGQGSQIYESGDYYKRIGTFVKGVYTPDVPELYKALGTADSLKFAPTDAAIKFLTEHSEFFPASDPGNLDEYLDPTILYKELAKTPGKFGDSLLKRTSYTVLQTFESVDVMSSVPVLTTLLIGPDSYSADEIYYVFYLGALDDIYAGDTVTFYGLPIGSSSYENIGGGITLTQVIAASYVIKE